MVFSPPEVAATTVARILIVEDEGIIAGHIASGLLKTGYEVAGIAESSEEALEKTAQLNPDLILMDIRIKGAMDGIETTAKLRKRFDIPVIYLTAHTDQQTIDRAKMTGAFGFLTKPIQHTSLATAIEMAIHKHRADRAERHQRAWMATVLGTMADAMVVIDREGKTQFLNHPAEELTCWTNEDARGVGIALILPLAESVSGAGANDVFSLASDPHAPRQIPRELVARHRSGSRFPVDGEIAPSVDDGKVVGAVITFRDATFRQAREEDLRHRNKMLAVGRLAAGVAHDFNGLLFIILGYADEMLSASGVSDSDLLSLSAIQKAADSAATITRQLMQFSHRELGQTQDVNLNELIWNSESVFRRSGGHPVKWQFKLDQDLGTVRANSAQLKQVLMSLVSNARHAMPDGGRLTVETSNVDVPVAGAPPDAGGAFVSLIVTDTGTGMSAQTASRLFEPFFTTKEPGAGAGLGLSIVHSIVTDLHGTIRVNSDSGNGTIVTVCFPRAGAAAETSFVGEPALPGKG